MPARKHTYRFLAVIAVLTAASAVVAWRKATQEQPAAKPAAMAFPVKTAAPQHLPVADSAHAVGSFIADESAVVSAEIGGRVKSIHFTEGLSVKAGELLILLDPDEHQATAAQSRAQANLDKLNLGRTEEVRRRNLASQQALDEARRAGSNPKRWRNGTRYAWEKPKFGRLLPASPACAWSAPATTSLRAAPW